MEEHHETRSQRAARRIADALFEFAINLQRYSVEIPWESDVRWPDRCARCHAPSPDTTFSTRIARPTALGTAFNFNPPWALRSLVCPSCRACHLAVRRQRLRSVLIPVPTMAVVLVGGIWVMLMLPYVAVLTPILRIGIILFAIALGIGIRIAIGDPIDVITEKRTLRFEFKDHDFAEEFAAANGTTVIDPEPLTV
ncbi:MAG: hypothetical protein NXI14_14895 [bacterium]|nr:hypothetical protein [bacterium]